MAKITTSKPTISRENLFLLLSIILISFSFRLLNLSYPSRQYFDEVYHGFTATQYLHNNPDAYNVWAKPPEGKAFEWTHPPLAKLFMAGSMKIFGENSFGWRFSSVVFGTGAILLTALIAYELFSSPIIMLLSAAFLSLDGLHFVQSRIAMNDSHFLFFFLATLLCYLKWKRTRRKTLLLTSGIMLGLAVSSKWTAVYSLGIIGIDQLVAWIRDKKIPFKTIFRFFFVYSILPLIMYLISYSHFFLVGYKWNDFVNLQKQMWWYHTRLSATHSYQSRPWQWVFDLRPVWMYVNYEESGKVGNIYNLGNPVLFYVGFSSIVFLSIQIIRKWEDRKFFLLLAYFTMWLPWTLSPRIMFFYHYLPAVPMLSIASSVVLHEQFSKQKKSSWIILVVLLGITLWFLAFYPNLTGLPMPKEFVNKVYFAIPSWK